MARTGGGRWKDDICIMVLKKGFKDTCTASRLYAQFCIFCVDFSEESLAFINFSKAAGSLPHKFRAPLFRVTKLGLNYILCPYEDFSEKSACPGLGFCRTVQSLPSG